jgi:hypothetical protein
VSYDSWYDDGRADAAAEAREDARDEARRDLLEAWRDEHWREAQIFDAAQAHPHRLQWAVIRSMVAARDEWIEDGIDEYLDEARQDADPYRARGLSRSDFR